MDEDDSQYSVLEHSDQSQDRHNDFIRQETAPFNDGTHMQSPAALLFSPKTHHMFYHDPDGSGTFNGSIANLINCAIGAGVLALPFAYQQAGLLLSTALAFAFCPLITFTLHIMGRAQKLANKGTFQETCAKLLGPKTKVVVIILQLIFIFGACIGYLIIIADNLRPQFQQWFGDSIFIANRELIIAVSLVPIVPMCFIKNIQTISPLATLSILAIVYTLGMMVTRAILILSQDGFPEMKFGEISCGSCDMGSNSCVKGTDGAWHDKSCYMISTFRVSLSALKSLPVFCFAYNVHCTHSLVFAEMAAPKTLTKMDKASGISLSFCAFVYISCGFFGYLYTEVHRYNDGIVPGNALLIYPPEIDVALARLSIAVSVVGSFTTLHFSAFYCFQDLLAKVQPGTDKAKFTPTEALAERVTFIGVCTAVALGVKNLDVVVDITGAISVIPMVFIIPGMLQLRLHDLIDSDDDVKIPFYDLRSRFCGWFLIVLGVAMGVSSLAVIILELAGVVDAS